MSAADRIAAAVAATDFGIATAMKRGRNPRWPYVPVIDHGINDTPRGHTEQIRARAFATRDEAIAFAEKTIRVRQASLARQLGERHHRTLREQHGLPRELEDLNNEEEQ